MESVFFKVTFLFLEIYLIGAEIRQSALVNKLVKVKPVGSAIAKKFVPLTEIPPPSVPPHIHNGRRHLNPDCLTKPEAREVEEGVKVGIFGDYYDDKILKTVATVIIPDHIDKKHFEVTSPIPYFTVGTIDAIGYHPSTIKSEHPSECEKIYQDHIAEQYSDEDADYSEESLEMARMPLYPDGTPSPGMINVPNMYSDLSM